MTKVIFGYMARKQGSIGIHYPVSTTVETGKGPLQDQAFDKLHKLGYETIHPIGVYKNGEPPTHVKMNPHSEHVD